MIHATGRGGRCDPGERLQRGAHARSIWSDAAAPPALACCHAVVGEGRRAPSLCSISLGWLLHGVRGREESVDRTEQSRVLFGGKRRLRPDRNAADVGSQRLLAERTRRMLISAALCRERWQRFWNHNMYPGSEIKVAGGVSQSTPRACTAGVKAHPRTPPSIKRRLLRLLASSHARCSCCESGFKNGFGLENRSQKL
jgi:hypothetical protein